MKIIFNHTFGKQTLGEVYHFNCSLTDVKKSEYNDALEQGFLIQIKDGKEEWYQCRNTRIDLSKTNFTLIENASLLQDPLPLYEMDHIYTAYCYHKNYKKYYEVNQYLPNDQFIGYYDYNHNLIGWTKLRRYSDQCIETCIFVWDYNDPKLSLGINSLYHELAWAKAQGYKYVYTGPGYEKSNIYKSNIAGFEWWTGSLWSSNIEQYVKLCKRDSKIMTVADLHDVGTKP